MVLFTHVHDGTRCVGTAVLMLLHSSASRCPCLSAPVVYCSSRLAQQGPVGIARARLTIRRPQSTLTCPSVCHVTHGSV